MKANSQWFVYNKKADFFGLAKKFNVDPVIIRVMRNREVIGDEEIRKYLTGDSSDFYDPHLLKDVEKLTDILIEKFKENKTIRIIGDYDIDGVMSSYILKVGLGKFSNKVSVRIPDRKKDGYGLNMNLINSAYEDGVDTIITCDNGIAAIDEIAHAKELKMTVLVTDHHEIPYKIEDNQKISLRSEADAIVNPHQEDCKYPNKKLCGAAVAWKVICVLYEKMGLSKEESDELIEMAAFATVGDVMDLIGENRIIVKEGLKRIKNTKNIGMKALIAACGIDIEQINAFHFGFVLGPCINASGRLETAIRALELFLSDNALQAKTIAEELVALNEERKELTVKGTEEALEIASSKEYENDTVLVLYLPNVPESIVGIIAGRVRESQYKPVFVLTKGEEFAKGSGRSIEEYSMFDEMCKCRELFTKFGGHPMAAGLSMEESKIEEFRKKINEISPLEKEKLTEKVHVDFYMPVDYVTMDLVRQLDVLAPFGKANEKPMFVDKNLRIKRMIIMGKNKNVLKLFLISESGKEITTIYFGDINEFQEFLIDKFGEEEVNNAFFGKNNKILISMVYYPTINVYNNSESLQFQMQYFH
ncbi:single-stranded-DNA-specific exonuclease RecJ [Lachnobacterium bovis]|uniref:Single-stranded-DNA-specific exonuclease RecJ n=1 Tax=Lachnobacterium bovis DSM 14045 TaxID=1122142 RepID=A0A1H3JH23_9FIRM|nr:single-stranded-DNA-specific exonuclease RecJ [Lachnobacterium bovis]MBQ1802272.1 single-stranded-DNA-specific exonuclease RecJ [Lachnobacterium sp.]SDY39167.1 single-stranded-DNA-specific exonuclease [Lachnobacterium bovis DSM 14045]